MFSFWHICFPVYVHMCMYLNLLHVCISSFLSISLPYFNPFASLPFSSISLMLIGITHRINYTTSTFFTLIILHVLDKNLTKYTYLHDFFTFNVWIFSKLGIINFQSQKIFNYQWRYENSHNNCIQYYIDLANNSYS